MKKIAFSLLFIFLFLSINVNANDLVFEASSTNPEGEKSLRMLLMVRAHDTFMQKYDTNYPGQRGTFQPSPGEDKWGGSASFATHKYALHKNGPMDKKTNYDGAFNTTDGNYINAYYDASTYNIPVTTASEIDTIFSAFSPVPTSIHKWQNKDTTGDLILDVGTDITTALWTITPGNVSVKVLEFSNDAINKIYENYSLEELQSGVRISNITNTADFRLNAIRSHMDTSYKFLRTTVGYWWAYTRGFNNTDIWTGTGVGTYYKGASAVNLFDNIIKFPIDGKVEDEVIKGTAKTHILINTVDTNGNVLNTTENYFPNRQEGVFGYQSKYVISGEEFLDVKAKKEIEVDGKKYKYSHGKDADVSLSTPDITQQDVNKANEKLKNTNKKWNDKKFTPFPSPTLIVVNLVYKEEIPSSEEIDIPLELKGRLCFINKTDPRFKESTNEDIRDYISSSPFANDTNKSVLKAYIKDAYDYVIRALAFEENAKNISSLQKFTTTAKIKYKIENANHSNCTNCFEEPSSKGTGVVHYEATLKDGAKDEHTHKFNNPDDQCGCYGIDCSIHSNPPHNPECYNYVLSDNPANHTHYFSTYKDQCGCYIPKCDHIREEDHLPKCYNYKLKASAKEVHTHKFNNPNDQCGCYVADRNKVLCTDLTQSGEYSVSVNYNLDVLHKYYDVTNFKMYKIKDFILYNTGVRGGELFDSSFKAGGETIKTSDEYNEIFKKGSWIKPEPSITKSMAQDKIYDYTKNKKGKENVFENVNDAKKFVSGIQNEINNEYLPENASDLARDKNLSFTFEGFRNEYLKGICGTSTNILMGNELTNTELYVNSSDNFKDGREVSINKGTCSVDSNGYLSINSKTTNVDIKNEVIDTRKSTKQRDQSYAQTDEYMERHYVSNVPYGFKPENDLTDDEDFEDRYFKIPVDRDNGERVLSAKINYELIRENDIYERGGNDEFNAQTATYDGYYKNRTQGTGLYKIGAKFLKSPRSKEISKEEDVNIVNIFTPIAIKDVILKSNGLVIHSNETNLKDKVAILQKNVPFVMEPDFSVGPQNIPIVNYKDFDTKDYIEYYYYIFDFDVRDISNPANIQDYAAKVPIKVDAKNPKFTGIPIGNISSDATDLFTNKYQLIAIAKNTPENIKEREGDLLHYSIMEANNNFCNEFFNLIVSGRHNHDDKGTRSDLINDSYHIFTTTVKKTENITRLFDFRVSDCTDLAFKEIFRKREGNKFVNKPTGNVYYSGTKYWDYWEFINNNIPDITQYPNQMKKTPSELKIPLGPKSHLNKKYKFAPKMGYRISYDFKTTGSMNIDTERKATIIPSYYYISKDAETFIPPYDPHKNPNIELYYLNDENVYTKLNNDYSIYYKPNDGYRYINNSKKGFDNNEFMSKEFIKLKISKMEIGKNAIGLYNSKSATEQMESGFIQAWYGEFKLPNSTIAIPRGGNINNPLKDGYLGVIFDISVRDDKHTLNYAQDDINANPSHNTSQWDYEGFLGFENPGQNANIEYELEKEIWRITDDVYQKIKGTVVMFDLDNRAANDFE